MVTRTPLDYNYIGSICTIFENGYESYWNFYKKMQQLVLKFNAILILNTCFKCIDFSVFQCYRYSIIYIYLLLLTNTNNGEYI